MPAAALLIAFFVTTWGVYVEVADVRDVILPSPSAVARSLVDNWDIYRSELAVTFREAVIGFLLAVVVGLVLATLVTVSRVLRLALYPLIVASQAMPVIALAPLLVVWYGFGPTSKILVAALIAFFPIVVSTAAGLASLDGSAVTLMESFPANRYQRSSFGPECPTRFLRCSPASRWRRHWRLSGAVVGEWVSADAGLGYLIIRSNATLATEIVFGRSRLCCSACPASPCS